jgi:hypothetical protein
MEKKEPAGILSQIENQLSTITGSQEHLVKIDTSKQ